MTVTAPVGRLPLTKIKDETLYLQHQLDGIRKWARVNSFILGDDMGLGKSLQALTIAAIDFQLGHAKRVLIVAPPTLLGNWTEEIEKFSYFSYTVLQGDPKKRGKQLDEFEVDENDVLLCSYGSVVSHVKDLNALGFDIVIYDEAHLIKGHKSARTKACHKLRAGRHLLLTGSPLLNQVNELWSLFHRIDPITYSNYWTFVHRYCNTPEAPIWMADGTFKPIGEIVVGDKVMGWTENSVDRRHLCESTVEAVERRVAPVIIRSTLASGAVIRCTPDHLWLSGNHGGYSNGGLGTEWVRIKGDNLYRKGTLSRVVNLLPEPTPEQQRAADWIAGMYDGEASRYFIAQSKEHNPAVHARIAVELTTLGIPYTEFALGYTMRGGRDTWVKLLNWTSITRKEWLVSRLTTQLNRTKEKVMAVEYEGPGEVVSMQTSTGNYVAWGLASKNCVFGGFKEKQIVGVKNKAELEAKLKAVLLRRTKKDLGLSGKLPPIDVYVDIHPSQAALIKQAKDEMKLTRANGTDIELANGMVAFMRKLQILSTPANLGFPDESYKLDRAVMMAEEIISNGLPLVMFTQFRPTLECMTKRLNAAGIDWRQLHGDVPQKDRIPTVKAWSEDAANGRPQVLLVMLQVGGTGLNLVAADTAIFLDELFVPKLNDQAEDRLDRMGQTQPVTIYRLRVRRSQEDRKARILKTKAELFRDVVDEDDFRKKLLAAMEDEDE